MMSKIVGNGSRGSGKSFPTGLPKLCCGADVEVGNFIIGQNRERNTCYEASRAVLREIKGLPRARRRCGRSFHCPSCGTHRFSRSWQYGDEYDGDRSYDNGYENGDHPQDWGRKFLPANGGCVYIDLGHLELCIPEVVSAYDHVAAWHAMLRIALRALTKANEKLPHGQRIVVLVNNSDGQNSYGSHLNFLVSRRTWENLFTRKLHQMLYLAAYQVSSIVFTGQGKVGSENGAPPVSYQIAARADHLETVTGLQTTFRRPIVNSRNEPHCGRWRRGDSYDPVTGEMARLHVIFHDSTLCHVSSLLKVGALQIVLAMMERERINPGLLLDNPVEAVVRWSHDPSLRTRVPLASGRRVTAVELQLLFLEDARRFVEEGGCDEIVPHAGEILSLWEDTSLKLKAGELASLAPRLDWVLKRYILERAMTQNPQLDWDSPEIKHLDHLYSSLDPREGLYWIYERSGFVERVVSDARIEQFVHEPPADTRAWTRAMLLRKAGDAVNRVDWDHMTLKVKGNGPWFTYRTVDLANPLGFTKAETEHVFQETDSLEELVDVLESPQTEENGAGGPHSLRSEGDCSQASPSRCQFPEAPVEATECSGS